MSAKTLNRTIKPLTVTIATLLLLTLISSAAAASGITVNYSLQGSKSSSVQRQFTTSGTFANQTITETRSDNLSASGAATVTWLAREISANGSITITRNAAFKVSDGSGTRQGSENETSTLTFSTAGEALENFGPLMGRPTGGTLQNLTINGQTYLTIHVSRSFTDHISSTATETFTKTGDLGRTYTVTVTRTVTRDISLSADFWFSKSSGILLQSSIQGNIKVQVSANGQITGPYGIHETFTMTATYTEMFSRTVMATSISGLSG